MTSTLSSTWPTATISLGIAGILAVIILFVQASFTAQSLSDRYQPLDSIHKLDADTMLSVLQVAQAVLVTMTVTNINQAFELIQWVRSSGHHGISYTSFLGLSPTTGPWDMYLLITAPLSRLNLSTRLWVVLR